MKTQTIYLAVNGLADDLQTEKAFDSQAELLKFI